MELITRHEPCQSQKNRLWVIPIGGLGNEGAVTEYLIALGTGEKNDDPNRRGKRHLHIQFQNGHFDDGVNGVTDESLLAVVEHRLQMRVAKNPNSNYAAALSRVSDALDALHVRTLQHENPQALGIPVAVGQTDGPNTLIPPAGSVLRGRGWTNSGVPTKYYVLLNDVWNFREGVPLGYDVEYAEILDED